MSYNDEDDLDESSFGVGVESEEDELLDDDSGVSNSFKFDEEEDDPENRFH